MGRRKLVNLIISILALTVLVVLYGLSFYLKKPQYWESILLTTLVYLLFFTAILYFIPHLTSFLSGDEQPHLIQSGDRTYRRCGAREIAKLVLIILAFRLIELLLTYVFHYIRFGYTSTFMEVQRVWLDFYHEDRVFPLYRYVTNVFWIFTFNFNHARFLGSYVFTALAGAALYALVLFDFDRKTARRAIRYFFFLPISYQLMGSVPDGLFILLSCLALLFMRKRRYWAANIIAMLAAATHAIGALLFFPILADYIAFIVGNVRSNREMGKGYLSMQIVNAVSFICIPIGIGIVMLYASLKFGDSLALYRVAFDFNPFSVNNIPGSMFRWIDVIAKSSHIITTQTIPSLFTVILPQIIYLILACVLIIFGCGKVDTSYLLLLIVTIPTIFAMNQSQDAAHLLTLTVPMYITLAVCVKKRWLDATLTVLSAFSWVAYFYAFVCGYTGGVL